MLDIWIGKVVAYTTCPGRGLTGMSGHAGTVACLYTGKYAQHGPGYPAVGSIGRDSVGDDFSVDCY